MLQSVFVYLVAIIFAPLILLWYRNIAWAILAFVLNVTVIGWPIASLIGIVGAYKARHI